MGGVIIALTKYGNTHEREDGHDTMKNHVRRGSGQTSDQEKGSVLDNRARRLLDASDKCDLSDEATVNSRRADSSSLVSRRFGNHLGSSWDGLEEIVKNIGRESHVPQEVSSFSRNDRLGISRDSGVLGNLQQLFSRGELDVRLHRRPDLPHTCEDGTDETRLFCVLRLPQEFHKELQTSNIVSDHYVNETVVHIRFFQTFRTAELGCLIFIKAGPPLQRWKKKLCSCCGADTSDLVDGLQ
ncbi:hypothetical protein HG531_004181 [Fusarium graminearum]|nr:hypothetical protein HG531_004181 [Fusarium graminearum]